MAAFWLILFLTTQFCILITVSLPQQPGSQHVFLGGQSILQRFTFEGPEALDDILDAAEQNDLDVWQVTNAHVDVLFTPTSRPLSLPKLLSKGTAIPPAIYSVPTDDTQRPIEEWNIRSFQNTTFHGQYHPLYEIDGFMEDLAALHPDLVKLVNIGHSAEGREMFAISISKPTELGEQKRKGKEGEKSTGKPGFVVTGAQHAREWVATAAALYIAHSLVANGSEPESMSSLLDHFDFHIIPTPNPDGYVYTWEKDRFWYKNRMIVSPEEQCQGLDMNRNWGYHWSPSAPFNPTDLLKKNKKKKPKIPPADPCSVWYPGRRPFEAPEVNNIANFITQTPRLVVFVDLRSYGQMLSTPYSYSCNVLPADAEDQLEAALGVAHAIKKKHGTSFTTGSLCSMLYSAPGNIVDWMYGEAHIKYSFAAHLRDTGTYGYALPPEWIRPVGEETGTMIEYLARFVAKNGRTGL
ncbi:hypothetical protein BD410DRAFT_793044 [Rickenella mellea]|uniref:Inactive metallocarboxypeptidase ECM14 n=1 Tax=Rickenella mellea TaxID=50990 RepID=A0A4Y7PUE2_9AGAM|nr:hypothetical protein BD410DRAFT_793044 [Rickenella mellea]